jgi:tetratricopeptide (TPR) repeat protein
MEHGQNTDDETQIYRVLRVSSVFNPWLNLDRHLPHAAIFSIAYFLSLACMASPFATHEHHEFLAASREALASPNLQLALSRLGETLAAGNRTAFEKLTGSSLLRDKARAIKDETLAHLDVHLEQLERAIVARGGHVHFAADGPAAVDIVREIIKSSGTSHVVKSKSMVTEEIHLNRHLEDSGIEVTETDFGEFIIQVAGERPSHLVGPALHKTAEEMADLMMARKEFREAVLAYRKLTEVNPKNAVIYNKLGIALHKEYDLTGALRSYERAVKLDPTYADAQNNIGVFYDKGYGVAQDYGEAMRWYRMAANQGNIDAEYNLALLYADGHGVPRDLEQARQWMQKAAEAGDPEAKKWLGNHGG